jgi:hypothetical protein
LALQAPPRLVQPAPTGATGYDGAKGDTGKTGRTGGTVIVVPK